MHGAGVCAESVPGLEATEEKFGRLPMIYTALIIFKKGYKDLKLDK